MDRYIESPPLLLPPSFKVPADVPCDVKLADVKCINFVAVVLAVEVSALIIALKAGTIGGIGVPFTVTVIEQRDGIPFVGIPPYTIRLYKPGRVGLPEPCSTTV